MQRAVALRRTTASTSLRLHHRARNRRTEPGQARVAIAARACLGVRGANQTFTACVKLNSSSASCSDWISFFNSATSLSTKRAGTRAAASPALLGASHARRRLPARDFAEAGFVRRQATAPAARQAVPGRGDFGGGEQRSGGLGARSALRELTRRRCPSAESEANEASWAARARSEQRSGVGPQGRPPRHEPLPGTAWRDARTPPMQLGLSRTAAPGRQQPSNPNAVYRSNPKHSRQ